MKRILSPICWSGVTLLAGLFFLSGCSRPVGTVSGKVTYMNKALKGGSVTFVSTEGNHSFSCEIQDDGTYTMANIRGGEYKVLVDTSYLRPATSGPGGYTGSGGKGFKPGGPSGPPPKSSPPPGAEIPEGYKASNPADAAASANAKKFMQIPESYKDADKTDLKYKVVAGPQTYNIDLK